METRIKEKEKNKTQWSKMRRADLIFYVCLIVIPLLQFSIFWFGSKFNAIFLAFKLYDENGNASFAGFANFKKVIDNVLHLKNYHIGMRNGFLFWLLNTVTQTPLTLLIAYSLSKKLPGGKFFKVVLFAPSLASTMVMVVLYEYFCEEAIPAFMLTLFHKKIGGLISTPDTRFITLWLFGFWNGFGSGFLMYANAITSISDSIVEAAEIDGVNFVQEFIYITFPMIYNTFAIQLIVSLGGIFSTQFNLYEFYGYGAPTSIQTVGYYQFIRIFLGGEREYPELTAFGLMTTLVFAPLMIGLRKLNEKIDPMH